MKDKQNGNKTFTLPEPKNGVNLSFANASNELELVFTKAKGRHVIAKSYIKIGDILFVEKPFTLVVLKEACHCCCAEIIAPIP